MKKVKVMEFIPMLNDGGAETLVVNYGLMMDRKSFEPVIVLIHNKQNTANFKRINGKVRTVSVYKTNSFVKKIMYRLIGKWYIPARLKSIIKKEKPDVIHMHLPLLKYIVPISRDLKGIKLIYTCHNEPRHVFAPKRYKEEAAAKYLIRNNGLRLIALHEDMRSELNQRFEIDNTVIIKNGIDFNVFRNVTESKEEIRKMLDIPEDSFVLGHIGRYAEQKNHDFLVEIFKEVVRKNHKAFLLLIGTGEKFEQIENKIKESGYEQKVKMFKSRSDIPQIFKSMDVFVFPSLFEGLSVSMVEAQAAGVKCVVSDKINPATFLSSKTIVLSLDDSAEKWAETILDENVVSDREYGNIDDYDLNKEIKNLENLYKGN